MLSVKKYGAVGDGATDDTVAIQAAADACAGKSVLFFPHPTVRYKITAPIVLTNMQTVRGESMEGTVIRNYGDDDAFYHNTPGGSHRLTFSDLTIDNGCVGRTAGAGIHMTSPGAFANYYSIENMNILYHQDGIRAKNSIVSTIQNVVCNYNDRYGFYLEDTTNAVSFISTYANHSGSHGYYLRGNYCSFNACASDNNAGDGYHFFCTGGFDGPHHITMSSCGSESNSGHGIFAEMPLLFSIDGGYFINAGVDGIHLEGAVCCELAHCYTTAPGSGLGLNHITHVGSAQPTMALLLNGCYLSPAINTTNATTTLGTPSSSAILANSGIAISYGGTLITLHKSGTDTWDPGSINDGDMTSTTLTVASAVIGDTVAVGFSKAIPAGALLVGAVTAYQTVTVTLFNKTGGVLDLDSGTLRADIWQH